MTKGQRIKQLRENAKMTQYELAVRLNTTKQTISKYEKDIVTNIPSDRIEELCVILNSTPEYILGWENIEKKNDILSDIILRLRTDNEFMSVVEKLYNQDAEKIAGIDNMLSAFLK